VSFFLTEDVARQAVNFVLPAVQALIDAKVVKRGDMHIVIGKPDIDAGSISREVWYMDGILYQHSLGIRSKWGNPYDEIARSKCYLSWRHGMPTQLIQACAPHLLERGDTGYYGSAVSHGLAVACSGVQPYFDQMISSWVLEMCRALAIDAREKQVLPDNGFLP
jgi:hypothetical protein